MILVDTSVWIRALANREPFASGLSRLLSLDEVAGHDLVYGELLIGDTGGRRKLLVEYEQFHQARIVPHHEVATFVRRRLLCGRGLGWIDVHLLASALAARFPLWTADGSLQAAAKELGVAYEL